MELTRARPSTSLRTQRAASRAGLVTMSTRESGIKPPVKGSYAERYRGTEYDTGHRQPPPGEPLLSDARLMVITSAVLTVVAGAGIAVWLG